MMFLENKENVNNCKLCQCKFCIAPHQAIWADPKFMNIEIFNDTMEGVKKFVTAMENWHEKYEYEKNMIKAGNK